MKFLETHFEDYINEVKKMNLHPKLEKYYSHFPKILDKLGNLILYVVGYLTTLLPACKSLSFVL